MERRTEFQTSILVCTPMRVIPGEDGKGTRREPVTIEWHRAMKQLLCPMGYNQGEIIIDGYEVGEARNLAVKECLKRPNIKYLMFIDADTILPQNGLQLLTYDLDNNPDYDIAAGLYTQKSSPPVPLIWQKWGSGTFCDFTLGDVLYDMVGAATGCMLIRTSLFERLAERDERGWFWTDRGEKKNDANTYQYAMSDDIFFCKRAVEEADAKLLVDTKCYCKHIDWKTGTEWQLRDDSLPARRLAAKLGEISDTWLTNEVANGGDVLKKLAQEVVATDPDRTKVIVEVGSFVGSSSRIFAEQLQGHGTLYCVDTWQGTASDESGMWANWIGGQKPLLNQFKKNLAPYLENTVVPVVGTSVESSQHLKDMGIVADLVFLDADHMRVAEDIAAWLPLVRPGGIICGHDYDPQVYGSVVHDVDEAFSKTAEVESSVWVKRLVNAQPEVSA